MSWTYKTRYSITTVLTPPATPSPTTSVDTPSLGGASSHSRGAGLSVRRDLPQGADAAWWHRVPESRQHGAPAQPGLVEQQYAGKQCSGCSTRFPTKETVRYSQHLDWHFRQNRRDRTAKRIAQSRPWHYTRSDWLQFEEVEDQDVKQKSWFEAIAAKKAEVKPVVVPSVKAGALTSLTTTVHSVGTSSSCSITMMTTNGISRTACVMRTKTTIPSASTVSIRKRIWARYSHRAGKKGRRSKRDLKEELIKKYLIPSNTKLLDAPKLNRELEGLLNDSMKARDKRVEERQQQMGVATGALLSSIDSLIKNDVDKIKLISIISDVTRLLMDLHYQDTVTRKKLIIPNLDKNIGKTVENLRRDEYLFGEKFNDSVKTATAIKKSAGTILKQNTPQTYTD
ncbi:unnamed protein product [Chilo suppressalis]|uniref:C2H2-type domain-containing protein n=1 Tax=Chilo suppressalis TaxID=168631 RepID=A0ABN8ATP2_CHISP|nr:hypothetical protein evm_004149 [Chilo suppressalis]CAH0397607.1 unnamed protein product [Chilo suppressalis]